MLDELLLVLTEFGAGPAGSPANAAVRFLLPAAAWLTLLIVARRQWRDLGETRDRLIAVAAVFGLFRELFMFVCEYGGYRGYVPQALLHRFYPPIEHAATMVSVIVVGYAFIVYFFRKPGRSPRWMRVGLIWTALLYVVIAPAWFAHLVQTERATGAPVPFGSFWGDMAFRISAVIIFSHLVYLFATRRRGGVRIVPATLVASFTMFFLDELLMVVNLAQGEVHRAFFAPVRHSLHIMAVFLVGGGYWADLRSRLVEARDAVRAAKQQIEAQYHELQKLDRVKDGLIRDVSHELKTPVAKQAMCLEIIKGHLSEECPPEVGRMLEVMESSVKRQGQVIQSILDLSRLEQGGRAYAFKPVRIDTLLRDVLAEYAPLTAAHGLDVRAELAAVTATTDGGMLWHVFSNVVNNAVKFRRRQGTPALQVTCATVGGTAVVTFSDNGIGVRPADIGRVFDRFFQATPTVEGSGVGLTIAGRITRDLGGTIDIASAGEMKGTTVTVTLPLAPPAAA